MRTTSKPSPLPRSLRWPLRLTWAGLWAESLLQAFWPLASLALLVFALPALGVLQNLPRAWLAALGVAAGLAALAALVRGLRRLTIPTSAKAVARLDATLKGRPINALLDAQAAGTRDPASKALWQAHIARAEAAVAKVRAPLPDPDLNAQDPFALRLIALTLAVVAGLFGSVNGMGDLLHRQDPPTAPRAALWEGWIRPPTYTGHPTIYLNQVDAEALEVPKGSRVTLRFYDQGIAVRQTVSTLPLSDDPAAQSADFVIDSHGEIEVEGRLWHIAALPDLPPMVRPDGTPERQADGKMKLAFSAEDDFGVTKGQARITLDMEGLDRRYGLAPMPEARDPILLDLPMPFTVKRTQFSQVLTQDLSKHPFANLPVTLELQVEDASPQFGHSDPLKMLLPGKRFFDPIAAALIEVRRDLLWSVDNAPRAAQWLRTLTHRPETFFTNERAFLRTRVVIRRLEAAALTPEARDPLAEELWSIAMLLEDGDLNSALERLKRAQDRLDQAMKDGASQSEIEELMAELREAMDNYMDHLAQEGARDPSQQMSDLETMEMSADQLQELLDKLQQLMEEGRMAEAQELMELLRQLMENMQVTQGEGSGGQGEGRGRMRDLADNLRQQQDLSDETYREMQRGFNQGQGEGEGEGQGQSGEGRSLADRQSDLRRQLRALGGTEMPGDGSERAQSGREALDRAGRAMEEAERALRDGKTGEALSRQSEAMEALREGMRDFAAAEEQERQPNSPTEGGSDMREGSASGANRDPLGRAPGQSGQSGTDGEMLQGEDPYRRAFDLLEELRKRAGEQGRSEAEREYLRRLLEQF